MEMMIDLLNQICGDAFEQAGYDRTAGRVSVSNRPDLCEYQCNGAMILAKKEHKKPIDIANAVAGILQADPAIAKAEACMPGFLNMNLSERFLAEYVGAMQASVNAGLIRTETPKKIIVDYGGANVAKPLHVGHLRSAVIGEALKRMGAALGNEMTGDVHLGDWGLQMGLIIEELKDRGQTEFTLADLEEIYPAASKKSKETDDGKLTLEAAAFKARAMEATSRLQNGDPACTATWRRIMELSKADLKKNYDALDVHFELWKGESDVQKYIPDMLQALEERGIAYESQGALVVDVREDGDTKELPPCIVRKSDGSSLYATTDLATLVEREMLYHPDAYIYVADQRQSLHYLSFFRVARKAGIVSPDTGLDFLGFGTMNGKDGKPFKTRSGGVMRLEVLIQDICDAVYEKIRATRDENEISDAEAREISRVVGLAALKYGDLSNQVSKDYVFDIDRFTSFEGNTGPYILYTIVRIESILRKAEAEGVQTGDRPDENAAHANGQQADAQGGHGAIQDRQGEEECVITVMSDAQEAALQRAMEKAPALKALALVLSRYSEVVWASWEQLAPHKICQFIYELANAFNTFYHDVKVLGEEDAEIRKGYFAMLILTRRVLTDCINMLGFSAPERM